MTHTIASLVVYVTLITFFFFSRLECTSSAREASSTLCLWTKVLPNGEKHYSFLHQAAASHPPSMRLYQRHPLGCAWSDDAAIIQNYFALCQERSSELEFTDNINDRDFFDVVGLNGSDLDDVCVPMGLPEEVAGVHRGRERLVRSVDDGGRTSLSRKRVKRGFIVPGTLWCGSGNKALSYADLGVFSDTDSCCREHDQCKDTILSFQSEFGVFNSNIFTMSHCDCDNKFRYCLMGANDSISHVVGYTFFNLLKMHCFEFSHKLQCIERNWFGMCKETKMALYAEVHIQSLFQPYPNVTITNTTDTTDSTDTTDTTDSTISFINGTSLFINTTDPLATDRQENSTLYTQLAYINTTGPSTAAPSITAKVSQATAPSTGYTSAPMDPLTSTTVPHTSSASAPEHLHNTLPTSSPTLHSLDAAVTEQNNKIFPYITAAASTVPAPSISVPSASMHPSPSSSVSHPLPSSSVPHTSPEQPENTDRLNNTLPRTVQTLDTNITETQMSCDVYKDLDQCRMKILPKQRRYGLLNPEAKTLYHCNCTDRLFQSLARQTQMTKVQALLMEVVSQSCFVNQECTKGKICTAVLVTSQFPQLDQSSSSSSSSGSVGADVEVWRHLEAIVLQVGRPYNMFTAKRRERGSRLHRLCRKAQRPKGNKTRIYRKKCPSYSCHSSLKT